MNNNLLNILSNSNKDIDNQKLMDYLSGQLPEKEKQEVEQWMADNDFADEAMEGLQQFKQPKDLQVYVDALHRDLKKHLREKKTRREKRKIKEAPWVYLTLFILLLLLILAYVVIKNLGK
jgi:anti-sigma factor RsiW